MLRILNAIFLVLLLILNIPNAISHTPHGLNMSGGYVASGGWFGCGDGVSFWVKDLLNAIVVENDINSIASLASKYAEYSLMFQNLTVKIAVNLPNTYIDLKDNNYDVKDETT